MHPGVATPTHVGLLGFLAFWLVTAGAIFRMANANFEFDVKALSPATG
jgi:hypothetical protein